jgi:dihydrolipoamide dehydrogenase
MPETNFDLIVIGAGPGGYVAAIRAAQLGMRVACIDKQYLGGTCLNVGCIPSKALLDSTHRFHDAKHHLAVHGIKAADVSFDLKAMLGRKDGVVQKMTSGVQFLFKKNKIESFIGAGKIAGGGKVQVTSASGTTDLTAKNIIIATGSEPASLRGIAFDGKHIISSTEALTLDKVPGRLVIVGAGAIGLELGSVWNRLGSDVLVLEFLDRIVPNMDRDAALALQRMLEKQGMKFRFNTSAESAQVIGDRVQVTRVTGEERGVETCDRLLVAVGRRPHTFGLGLLEAGVALDKRGFVTVDAHFATNVAGVYAIGDVIGGLMLAHKAEEEGVACVEMLAGKAGHVNYRACPNVVYTHPELAQVGMSEEEARARGEVKVGKFLFSANGRARGMDETEGFVKIIGDAKTDRLLGVQILGANASDMIAEVTLAMEFSASCEDIARAFHAHPTLPEVIKEAALAAEKRAIHS